MEQTLNIDGKLLSFSSYKPKEGQEEALLSLVKKHLPTLRELGLATDSHSYIAKSTDGRLIEVFEWASSDAVNAAHRHPAISDIWEKMALIADFLPMNTLPEGKEPFCSFEMVK